METREFTAKTVRDAIEQAVQLFGVPREELEVEVLSEGKSGVFGIGAEEARIRVNVPDDEEFEDISDDEVVDTTRTIVETLLGYMDIEAFVDVRETDQSQPAHESSEFTVNITGDDLGLLIGRRGDTLNAFQYMVNLILAKEIGAPVKISVDCEHYKARRAQSLHDLAVRVADRVRSTRQAIALESMPPNERRLIHLTLRDHPIVRTESTGVGDERRVVISLKEGGRAPAGNRQR